MIIEYLSTHGFFGSSLKQYFLCIIYVLLAFSAGKIFYGLFTKIARAFTSRTKTNLDDLIIDLIDRPLMFLITLGGLYLGLEQLTLSASAHKFLDGLMLVLLVLNISWVVINFIDALILNYLKPYAEKSKSTIDDALVPIIGQIIKIFLWILVIIMLVTNFGYDVSALLAGLGLGGLAFALAAQDLLSNLFGGFAILTDKPFKIGDRVRWGTNDGFVRQIGFRTTRIETLDGTQLVVPNSELAKMTLENVSKEPARRVVVKLGLTYNTPTKRIKEAEQILKDIIKKRPELRDDAVIGFSDFGDFALVITLVYWVKDVSKLMEIKSSLNMEIKDKFEKAGLEFAYPTQSLIISNKTNAKKRK
jgi:MscS family membrane protein